MNEYRIRETGEVYDIMGLILAMPQYSISFDPQKAWLDEIGVDIVQYYEPAHNKFQYLTRDGIEWIKTADAIPAVPGTEDDPETPEDETVEAIPEVPEQGYYRTKFNVVDMTEPQKEVVRDLYRAQIWAEIRTERDRRLGLIGVPVTVNINGVDVVKGFETDVLNRTRYLRMSGKAFRERAGGAADTAVLTTMDGAPIIWKTMDNSFVPVTVALAIMIGDKLELQEALVFKNAETHKAIMMALTDPEGYDYSTGWPATYDAPLLDPVELIQSELNNVGNNQV